MTGGRKFFSRPRIFGGKEMAVLLLKIAVTIAGGALGFLYYKKVGCPTGTCPITSSPYGSTLYGAMLGFLVSSMF